MSRQHCIGIDLGTSNCAVAFSSEGEHIRVFEMPQYFGPGEIRTHPLLPSVLYYPTEHERAAGTLGLPWDSACPYVVGHLARQLGSKVPERLIHSAKSWLCHAQVDRRSPILPWAASEGVTHLSPVEVSASYLLYMKEAWEEAHPGLPFAEQEVVVTVPASFDAVARELTREAAEMAEIPGVKLVEEPQAAFYGWIAEHQAGLREALGGARLLLVCDVGGGTTDFTLVAVAGGAGEVELVRVAVGDHLLLGGDNMDLALAHQMEAKLAGGPGRLEPEEFGEMVHACRNAKESLLGRPDLERARISILGRGSGVVGGTRATTMERAELEHIAVDGFFPLVELEASPLGDSELGLKEWGLPYAADPAITRHLARFLRDAAPAVEDVLGTSSGGMAARPDAILFNGGVFTAVALRERLLEALGRWFGEDDRGRYLPRVLVNPDLGLAVARGACYYGLARRGQGVRIGGGSARSYYVGIASASGGPEADQAAVCVVPRGMEEEEPVELEGRDFRLTLGAVVRFPLFGSTTRSRDRLGDLVDARGPGLSELPPLETALEDAGEAAGEATVRLRSRLTATGTLELGCQTPGGDRAWRLEFDLRPGWAGGLPPAAGEVVPVEPSRIEQARRHLAEAFGGKKRGGPGNPLRELESILGVPPEQWDTSLLRQLWTVLDERHEGRAGSALHEQRWMQLAGWLLRPGFGDPLDSRRMDRLWKLAGGKLRFGRDEASHRAFWVMWRRVAPGLDAARQSSLFERVRSALLLGEGKRRALEGAAGAPGVVAEMWRLAAALERLDPAVKVELGDRMLAMLSTEPVPHHGFWVMARLAARQPVTGEIRQTVPRQVVQRWVPKLVRLVRAHGEQASFCVAHAARRTGDRNRDLGDGQRREVLSRMTQLRVPPRHVEMIAEVVHLGAAEKGALLGDAVPPGLRLAE